MIGWLVMHRCASCDAAEGTVHMALEASGIGMARAITLNPRTVREMMQALQRLGAALGMSDHATERVCGPLEKRLRAIDVALAYVPSEERPRMLGLESLCPMVA